MSRLSVLFRVLVICILSMLLSTSAFPAAQSQSSSTSLSVQALIERDLEFVPLYKLSQEDAISRLYANLELVGVKREDIVITTLASSPNKLVLQGPTSLIKMAKEILATIDPPPPPPPATPAELIDSIKIRNLSPTDFALKLDEVVNNFISMVKLHPSGDNFITYAKNISGANQITFYIPNIEGARLAFETQPQGFQGYQVFIRATTNEQNLINSIKQIISAIDLPVQARSYKPITLYYLQVDEAIDSLKSAGYYAVNTSIGSDPAVVTAIQSGLGPIIFTAPQVTSTTSELSTSLSQTGSNIGGNQFRVLSFPHPVATTDIHKLIVFGSPSEIASVENYLSLIDVPARQVLIEAQVIELNVDDLSDLGIRQVSGIDDILSGSINPVFPGESGSSPNPSGGFFIYNDANPPAGSFTATIAALILDGKATIKARPKVVAVDGRQAIITIGRQVPVVQETQTGDQRSVFEINFVPVGITLNIKPRIGRGGKEVQMQVDAVVSNVETLNNVVSELSLVAPQLNTREVSTIVRIPNHQSLILGGLISTELETRSYKVPILGDLPLIGEAFRRTRQIKDRTEIIIVITPHVAEENNPRDDATLDNPHGISDSYLLPLGSNILDNLDNVIFPGEYILKEIDLRGINMTSGKPEIPIDKIIPYSNNDPVTLTLINVIRKLDLVRNLKMLSDATVPEGFDKDTVKYYAEAFLLAYLVHVNKLNLADLTPGRRLLVPAFPISKQRFEERELAWHTVDFISAVQSNPTLSNLVNVISSIDGRQHVIELKDPPSDNSSGEANTNAAFAEINAVNETQPQSPVDE